MHLRLALLVPFVIASLVGCGGANRVDNISVTASGVEVTGGTPTFTDQDWPNWRGGQGDGTASDRPLPTEWDASHQVLWSADIPGRGNSSPVVADGVVYLTTALDDKQQQSVLAYDLESGSPKWSTTVHEGGFPPPNQMHSKSTHANGTIACDGELLFCAFLHDGVITATALNKQGQIAWQQEVGTFTSKFGYAPSVQVYRSLVIVSADHQGGGYLAALDRSSGKIAWRTARPAYSSYSSGRVVSVAGRDQLVISGCGLVASYDPATGQELWSCQATTDATCGTIVANDTHVFASGGFPGKQTVCIAADGSGKIEWSQRTALYEPSMLLAGNYLYGVTDKGIAYCWSATDGAKQWEQRMGGTFSASPVLCNGLIYVTNNDGVTFVFAAEPTGYREVAQNRLGDEAYASLAIAGSRLLARAVVRNQGRQEKLFCIGPVNDE